MSRGIPVVILVCIGVCQSLILAETVRFDTSMGRFDVSLDAGNRAADCR